MTNVSQIKPSDIKLTDTITATRDAIEFQTRFSNISTLVSETVGVDAIELDLKLTSQLNRYKHLTYDGGGNLTHLNIYSDSGMTTQFYGVVYNYDGGGNLTTQVVTRISDSYIYTKTFSYDIEGNLTSINITV